MPRKENTKAKTWERDRRTRMNSYFKTLADLLPPHQDGRKLNKVDVLIQASKYINDLHKRIEELFQANASEAHKEELVRLKKLVAQLFSRTQLLSNLLKEAGISVPAEPAFEKISSLKWSNKINLDEADKFSMIIEEKKQSNKQKQKSVRNKVPSRRKSLNTSQSMVKKTTNENNISHNSGLIENQENQANCINSKTDDTNPENISDHELKEKDIQQSNSNNLIVNKTVSPRKRTVVHKLNSQKKKRKRSKIIDGKKSTQTVARNSVPNLTSNTLIISGKLLPLVTPVTSLTPNIIVKTNQQSPNPIILGNTQQNQMIVMQSLTNPIQNAVICNHNQSINEIQKVTLNTIPTSKTNLIVNPQSWVSNIKNIINTTKIGGLKGILPKGKDITKTTASYKVPIPVIHKDKTDKEVAIHKENETKITVNKNSTNNIKNDNSAEKKNEKSSKDGKNQKSKISIGKRILKRSIDKKNDKYAPIPKKSKLNEVNNVHNNTTKITDISATCKSIESLQHVIEKIGENTNYENKCSQNDKELSKSKSDIDNTEGMQNDEVNQLNEMNSATSINDTASNCVTDNNSEVQSKASDETGNCKMQDNSMEKCSDVKTNFPKINEEAHDTVNVEDRKMCSLGTQFNSLLEANSKEQEILETPNTDNNKIILNLDTNTTTTMTPEINLKTNEMLNVKTSSASDTILEGTKDVKLSKSLGYHSENTFVPINIRSDGLHSDLSNDIFASLQVPSSSNNPESISPTAAFLMAFPLVSSLNGKTEVLDEEMKDDFKYSSQTPPMLLQIGTMEPNSFKLKTHTTLSHEEVTEKEIKTCESKKQDIPTTSHDELVGIDTPTTSKVLPKIVNEEVIREPYKIVQNNAKQILGTSDNQDKIFADSSYPNTTTTNNTISSNSNCQNQAISCSEVLVRTTMSNAVPSSENCITVSSNDTKNVVNPLTEISKCDSSINFSVSQDFIPNYSNIDSQQKPLLHNDSTYINTTKQNDSRCVPCVTTTTSLVAPNNIDTTNPSSTNVRPIQTAYIQPRRDIESQDTQHMSYNTQNNNNNIISNHRLHFVNEQSENIPISSGNLQQQYNLQTKDSSLPVFSSQNLSSAYNATSKDSCITNVHNSQQIFNTSKNQIQNTHSNYTTTLTNHQNQSYSAKELLSTAEENIQRNYTKLDKDSTTVGSHTMDHNTLESKSQDVQEQKCKSNYDSSKKIVFEEYGRSFSYIVKDTLNNVNNSEPNILTGVDSVFPEKRNSSQNYNSYTIKELKKLSTNTSTSAVITSSSHNTPFLQYSGEQAATFVTISNYEPSTAVENNQTKSTTTVAHNSSNFSILSWTTFSPVNNGNNANAGHYEQTSSQTENLESKSICEPYNTACMHKGSNYSNTMTNNSFNINNSVNDINKNRMKSNNDSQKQTYGDSNKSRNVQTSTSTVLKSTRMSNQNQSSNNNDFKFNNETKSKTKYDVESNYMQNEYSNINQSQQHNTKINSTIMPPKQDKAIYPMTNYDTQVNFDLSEVNPHIKYSLESYPNTSNKYNEKSQQNNQHKYQQISHQNQISELQHENNTYSNDPNKQTMQQQQQQQTTNKIKTSQHQHTSRPPVNWMMTPEIKHNTNISDIILPPIGKELDFSQNNLFSQTSTYNQGTSNQFYNNYDVTAHSFPNLPVLQSDAKRSSDVFYAEEQPFPWSPTKSNTHNLDQNQIKVIDQHIVPSTLPTLVGDLALGTNIPEKQNFLFGQMTPRIQVEQGKDTKKEADTNREFHAILNTHNVQQHAGQGSSFLSVSQLVEHEKAEKSQHHQQQQHQQQHHHIHQHQQQQSQQQNRKQQRKNSTSPRGNNKRQMETRKQSSTNDHIPQRHEEQKSSSHTFSEQNYQSQQQQQQQQQQKYQQNNVTWRNRNCKSNYTAEALIGTNNSVHDINNSRERHASIKFSSNYPQNKFQTNLPTTDTVMPINYFSNTEDCTGYGQMVNQNFNSYTYASNANIYPASNFITSISNTTSSYMMPLHDNSEYIEANSFLLPNVVASTTTTASTTATVTTTTANVIVNTSVKNHQYATSKHQNCEKRPCSTSMKKAKKKVVDIPMQSLEFPLSGLNSPLDDYHPSTTFLPPPHTNPLYQNHSQTNMYAKTVNGLPTPAVTGNQGIPEVPSASFNVNVSRGGIVGNQMTMTHHPSGTSLTNFNLSTIFPEMNDKITGYKTSNGIPSGLTQPNHGPSTFAQRTNYTTNALCHLPQVSETMQFNNSVPPPPPPPRVIHYKNV